MSEKISTEWVETKHFPAGSEPEFVYVWVQATNHEWVAAFTGLPVDEIGKRYTDASSRGMILSIKLLWKNVRDNA